MNAAIAQMNVLHCQKARNLKRSLEYLDHIDADIIVFPEVFTTGFCYGRIAELAETEPYPTIQRLKEVSHDKSNIIIGSIITSGPGSRFHNLGFVLDKGEVAGTYTKVHPFGTEKQYFAGGKMIAPIFTSIGLIGLMICYDLRFPEIARKLTLQNADILVTIAQFPSRRQNHWDTLVCARAIENQIPHLACNRIGRDPYNEFTGGSAVIDGWGRVLAHGDSKEGIITAQIDPEEKDRIRNEITCFSDRQETLY